MLRTASQSKKHAEWKQVQNFFLRHFDFLALEEKDLLQDWELVLCDVSSLESVALLSGLQRCFERVDAFFKEHAEALKKTWRQEFRHCLAKSSHGTISDGHFYEVILGEV